MNCLSLCVCVFRRFKVLYCRTDLQVRVVFCLRGSQRKVEMLGHKAHHVPYCDSFKIAIMHYGGLMSSIRVVTKSAVLNAWGTPT